MSLDASNRLLLIGLDSVDHEYLRRYLPYLPNIRSLFVNGEFRTLESTAAVMDASVWRSFATGKLPGEHGNYFPFQWDQQAMCYRRIEHDNWLPWKPFWHNLTERGLQVAAFDLPMSPLPGAAIENFSGYHWHTQEGGNAHMFNRTRAWTSLCGSQAPNKLGNDVPIDQSARQLRTIHREAIKSIKRRALLSRRLISNTSWQLFIAVFPELHRAAHYFCPDPESPQFDQQDLLLRELYQALDEGLGELLNSLDTEEISVGVFALHGMGPNTSQSHFLPQVLRRFSDKFIPQQSGLPRRPGAMALLRERTPSAIQNRLAHMSNQKVRDWVVNRQWSKGHDWSSEWVFSLLSGGQGYLRWNKVGREALGVFDPTEKTHAEFIETLKQSLYSLRESNTGEKIVADIVDVRSAYPGINADKLPDLSIIWTDLPPTRAIESTSLGRFSGRIMTGRGGNHRPNAFLLLSSTAARRATPLAKPTHIAGLGEFICALAT